MQRLTETNLHLEILENDTDQLVPSKSPQTMLQETLINYDLDTTMEPGDSKHGGRGLASVSETPGGNSELTFQQMIDATKMNMDGHKSKK
eukprot:UN26888